MLLRDSFGKKESGILMHISSLPSKYGIGSFGIEAYNFIDFLKKSNQRYWQILPLVPTGEGNSPYKSASCFAGEILYIDIDFLVRDGLLNPDDIPNKDFPKNVDFDAVKEFKLPLLRKAAANVDTTSNGYIKFLKENEFWLEYYAIFMAAFDEYTIYSILNLPDGLKYRLPDIIEGFKLTHKEEIAFYKITQYLFFCQYLDLKKYANKCGIKIIGDIPIYISLDSADVWTCPDNFKIGRDFTPILVAGVPPDLFSETGQLWGNPIYDWEYHKKTDFVWWKRRLAHSRKIYDVIRIDHFRAFADYYEIPYGSPDARTGSWQKGVGMPFWNSINKDLGHIDIIAEDLGVSSPEVVQLVNDTGFPNMKVLQFAFSGDPNNPHLPQNFDSNCVCYTGTHDNDTTLGWYLAAPNHERIMADRIYPESKNLPVPFNIIKGAIDSKARLVIIPIQDYLALDSNSRMNMPGIPKGNWTFRVEAGSFTQELADTILKITKSRN